MVAEKSKKVTNKSTLDSSPEHPHSVSAFASTGFDASEIMDFFFFLPKKSHWVELRGWERD